jgi:hypothetical protein
MADEAVAANAAPRQCRVCDMVKPTADFYTSNRTQCKDCVKARVRERARTNPSVQEYDRQRAKLPHRRENARRICTKWRAENPLGYAAHSAVSNAVRDGRLAKLPCLFCARTDVHAHHRDYAKPLDVIWLCPKCHHRLHAAFPETEGGNKFAGDA